MRVMLLFSILLLNGCEKVKDAFGLTHSTPDELALLEQPDLIVPPVLYENKKEAILNADDILKRRP